MIKKRSRYIIPPSFYKRTEVTEVKTEVTTVAVLKKEEKKALVETVEEKEVPIQKTETTPVNKTETTPVENKIVSGRRRSSSALSLKSLKKQKEEKQTEQAIDYSNMPKNKFSKAEFEVHWHKYIEILNRQGNKMLGSILNTSKPVLKETAIHLVYPNHMMAEELKKQQTKVLNYLREKLQNYQVKFNIVVDEKEEKTYAYTPQEKYVKLVEINPIIEEMRKTLFLDI